VREVLFRGKQIASGEWITGVPVQHSDGDWQIQGGHSNARYLVTIDPETVCQYTGLTDKAGRKIFEGDILSFSAYGENFRGDVRFINGNFNIWCGKCAPFLDDVLERYSATVIGNIFDNPELINQAGDRETK